MKTKGAELEVNALPIDGLTVWATASWLKTERKGFCTDPDGPFSAGLTVCGAPKFTYSAGIAYEIGLNDWGSVTAAADWQHQGKQTIAGSRVNELAGVRQFNGDLISHFREASGVVNASLIWRSPESRYQASFFVKNLTDELFVQAVTNVGGLTEIRVPNIRRHWGLEVSARVGN